MDDQLDIAINHDEIKTRLLASDMPEFRDNKEEGEILVESLSEFLEIPVNKQF